MFNQMVLRMMPIVIFMPIAMFLFHSYPSFSLIVTDANYKAGFFVIAILINLIRAKMKDFESYFVLMTLNPWLLVNLTLLRKKNITFQHTFLTYLYLVK